MEKNTEYVNPELKAFKLAFDEIEKLSKRVDNLENYALAMHKTITDICNWLEEFNKQVTKEFGHYERVSKQEQNG
jgi:hypothetical protein